jgi:hypothetical protein
MAKLIRRILTVGGNFKMQRDKKHYIRPALSILTFVMMDLKIRH